MKHLFEIRILIIIIAYVYCFATSAIASIISVISGKLNG